MFRHLFNSCNDKGLLKLIEIAVRDRGTRDNSVYLASTKKAKQDDDAEVDQEAEVQEALEVIEDLIIDSLPEGFDCWCGKHFAKSGSPRVFAATLHAHLSEYCQFFKNLREQALKLEFVGGE